MQIKSKIRTIPNFPKEGIMFRDITTLLKDPEGLRLTIDKLVERYNESGAPKVDVICGIEARGFILGAAMAYKMGLGFIPIRKKGKLPGETIQIHTDAISKGDKVLLVDDLLATGGTALGAHKLIEKSGGIVQEACFIVDLPDLGGGKKLDSAGIPWFALVDFDGE
jgi:adenine phosphoribosyltransferase